METSIKIVEGGNNLTLKVKKILLNGESLDSGQVQSVCSEIGKRYKIPAVPFTQNNKQEILIPFFCNLPTRTIPVNEWLITPSDALETLVLNYKANASKQLIADLYKRALLLLCKEPYWTLDSPRILYEKKAFRKIDGIAVVRRFEVSEVILEEGLGFSVGLTTSFFSIKSVLEYFDLGEQGLFNQISNRQNEQQGTLLYKGPRGYTKCYFVKYGFDKKLSDTPSFTEGGTEYANSFEYYQKKFPQYDVKADDKVVMVSFPGMAKQVYVAAKYLFPRIFNSALQGELQNIDKIGPDEKRKYLESNFWKVIGEMPFGNGFSKIAKNFFEPSDQKSGIIPLPGIIVGKNVLVPAPADLTSRAYKEHYRNRKIYLDKYGCYYVPPTLSGSKIYFVFPATITAEIQQRYADDTMAYIKKLTRNEIDFEVVVLPTYQNYLQATVSLKNDHENGMVVFVFDDANPATYSLIDFELKGWSLKRATSHELLRKYRPLGKASQSFRENPAYEKAKKDWDSYIEMSTLGIIQKLNCIPFTVQPDLFNYDMQIVIDVSEDFSHFCLSGLLYKAGMPFPILPCHTERKTDEKKETINPHILKDELIKMFTALKKQIGKYSTKKYLFARDGKDCGEEFNAVKEAFEQLKKDGIIPVDATFDFVEYHKTTRKEVRIWDVTPDNVAVNVLEGSFYFFRSNTAILCTTGDGTLSSRVTADPITIVNKYTKADVYKVLADIFYAAQFNFSNPRVAQKHSLPMKRADDELIEKRAQEIKRIK